MNLNPLKNIRVSNFDDGDHLYEYFIAIGIDDFDKEEVNELFNLLSSIDKELVIDPFKIRDYYHRYSSIEEAMEDYGFEDKDDFIGDYIVIYGNDFCLVFE